jgi:hypothetical protein
MGLLYKLFGYSLALSKSVPSLAAMVSGVHVYLIGKRLVGRWEGVLGALLFLFTFDVLRGSSHFTGANLALAFGMAAAYQAIARRPMVAGVLFALGTFTGVYIAPLALMLGGLLVFRSWRESLRLLGVYAGACLAIGAVFAVASGWQPFWYQIFGYNLHKIAFRHSWYDKFRNVAYLNSLVMIGFLPGIAWAVSLWTLRGRARGEPVLPGRLGRFGAWLNLWGGDRTAAQMIFATLVCGYFYFYSTRVDYYSYYFMLVMPWMGLATATVAVDVLRYVVERKHAARPAEPTLPRKERRHREQQSRRQKGGPERMVWSIWPLAVCAVVLACVFAYRHGIGEDRQTAMGEAGSHYQWRDSAYLPAAVNGLVRAVLWKDQSDPVNLPNAITYYLQHESMSAGAADGFVAAVRAQCRPGERIFGEYSLGPFAAALGPCVLAANLADTNPHRFKVHESTPEDWVAALEKDHLDIAIVARGDTLLRERALREYFASTFPRVVATWDDPYVGHVELHRRVH